MKKSTAIPDLRISRAALGRRLASLIMLAREGGISAVEFLPTIDAVFESCTSSGGCDEAAEGVNSAVYDEQVREVEKSVRRSQAARLAAKKRREAREAAVREATISVETHVDESAEESTAEHVEQTAEMDQAEEQPTGEEQEVIDRNDPWWDMSDDDYLLYSGRRRDGRPLTPDEKTALDVRRAVARQLGRYPYRPDPNWCRGSILL